MYVKHCKLSVSEQLELMKYFVAGSTARTAADIVGIHRNTAVRFFHKLREKIAIKQQNRSEQFCGKIELDEPKVSEAKVILAVRVKKNVVEVRLERLLFLAF